MLRFLSVVAIACAVSACAVEPPQRVSRRAEAAAVVEKPSTDVYAYPLHGQSEAQQDRDRYECYVWSVKQTGFDPSAPDLAPHQRVRVVQGPPAGSTTAAGAVTGAVLGAAVAGSHSTGGGAIVGAMAGAVMGAAAESQQQQRIAERNEQLAQQGAQASERPANYRRALSACLEARGYTVR